ncbi:DNA-dependent RNA polymerase II [Marasmius sp. AFHP31]|nr:DNA-dependent RNA polymerase II [Marasmius sp. AFHP31]
MPTGYDEEDEDGYGKIARENCWTVFSSFFEQKGLVRQQLDSFDEFVHNTMQELVVENSEPILDQAQQFSEKQTDSSRRYEIKFGQIYLSRPTVAEADGLVVPVFPQEARLRTLTYIEMKKRVLCGHEEGGEMVWETENDSGAEGTKVPIMLRSTFCILRGLQGQDLFDECLYDSGGYFIINGSGKVLITQERMATNNVYVFAKAQPSPTSFLAELRNAIEKVRKTIGQFQWYYEILSWERRIRYAQETLQKEVLTHVSMAEGAEPKQAYFFEYMIHRLLLAALERRKIDDQDHFGKKRLGLADPLLANLFRMLFRKLTKDVYRYMQKCTPFGG